MKIDHLEKWVVAGLLIDEHGEDALEIARERAGKALAAGDVESFRSWQSVAAAVAVCLEDPDEN